MRPGSPLMYAALGLMGFGIAVWVLPIAAFWWWIGLKLLMLAALVDLWFVMRAPAPAMRRVLPSSLALGVWTQVTVYLSTEEARARVVRVHDFHAVGFRTRGLPCDMTLEPGYEASQTYGLLPDERGDFRFEPAQALLTSTWGLWVRSVRVGPTEVVKVYPNFQKVSKYLNLMADQRLRQLGIHQRRRRGGGSDFHQLREYVQGDPLRHIDWKATSRQRKLITREFQDARDQKIVFLLDCGGRMRTRDDDLSHFDHALNAILLLAKVALQNGDAVGLITFAGDEVRRLAPRKGQAQVNLLLDQTYDVQPTLRTPDYEALTREVLAYVGQRSLLVLASNFVQEDETALAQSLALLRRRHLVVLAGMRESVLDEVVTRTPRSFEEACVTATGSLYLSERRRVHESLSSTGAFVLDTTPQALPVTLINTYFDIKGRNLL